MQRFQAYRALKRALNHNEPDSIRGCVEKLEGGQELLYEFASSRDCPLDAPTWQEVLTVLDVDLRRKVLRKPKHEKLNKILRRGLDEGWVPKKLSVRVLKNAVCSESVQDTTVRQLIDWVETWKESPMNDLSSLLRESDDKEKLTLDQFDALFTKQRLGEDIYEAIIESENLVYLRHLLQSDCYDRSNHLDDQLLDLALERTSQPTSQLFKFLYNQLPVEDDEWTCRFEQELQAANSSAVKMVCVGDFDQKHLNKLLEQAVEQHFQTNRSTARFIEQLTQCASTYPEGPEYGTWLLTAGEALDNYKEHFLNWLEDGGQVTEEVIEQAFEEGLAEIVNLLKKQGYLNRSQARSALRTMLEESRDRAPDPAAEVGVIHALKPEWLETREEKSLMLSLLERQADDPASSLATMGQALMDYNVLPRREEKDQAFELMVKALNNSLNKAEDWLVDLAEKLLERDLLPESPTLKELCSVSAAMKNLFERKLSRREHYIVDFC